MKRVSIFLMVLFLFLILFFTLFGKRVYEFITPKVEIMEVNTLATLNNMDYLIIPKTALTKDGSVYIVSEEEGFSNTIYTVKKKKIKYTSFLNIDKNSLYVTSGIDSGTMIVSQMDKGMSLKDGERVVPKE